MGRIIVVEDDLMHSRYICNFLEESEYRTISTSDCTGARELFSVLEDDDIVLISLWLPDGDGILLLEELHRKGRYNPYVIMADYTEVPTAVRSMKSRMEDYIPKKLLASQLLVMFQDLQKRQLFHKEPPFIRESETHQKVFGCLHTLVKADICMMVRSESGIEERHTVGKIHAQSDHADRPPVTAGCELLSESLVASALFEHEEGAFTGTVGRRESYWSETEGGALFLNEISNLPLDVQQMLLYATQGRHYHPVGGTGDRKVNVHIITTTNGNLKEAILERRFRWNLYFRLSEYTMEISPFRECPEDILPLAELFQELYN